jgi:hypothetical protein
VGVKKAVCGGDDPPQLSEYEKLRQRNIRERYEAIGETLGEIEEAKQDMRGFERRWNGLGRGRSWT